MLRLTHAQRTVLIQAFPAVAHVTAGGTVFSQFVRDRPFSVPLAVVGIAAWFALIGFALLLARKGEQ